MDAPAPHRAAELAQRTAAVGAYETRVRACGRVLESGLARLHGVSLKGMKTDGDNARGGGYKKERASL